MKVTTTALPGVLIIEPEVHGDQRGFFQELYHSERYSGHGIMLPFVQDNVSRSRHGVLRGLHYQRKKPQGKLIQVINGEVYDVAVDIRKGSPTFSQWLAVTLSGDNHRQLYIPPGYAHGFCVVSDNADFIYKCTDFFAPEDEGGVLWSDPLLAIDWPLESPLVSEKDRRYPCLSEIPESQLPDYHHE